MLLNNLKEAGDGTGHTDDNLQIISSRKRFGMDNKIANLRKIFGSGPLGLLISIILFFIASWFNKQVNLPPLSNNQFLLNSIFVIVILMTLVIIFWSVKSLPASDRGNKLCTSGAFKYVRHPLYSAFLSVFNFGLAIYLNSYVYLFWAVLLHPIWYYIVRDEERMMIEIFGKEYLEYQKKTGRFLPRLFMDWEK